ncbi:Lrp/AsnC family transcriptional regulator [Micromonospora sp. PLK6-60]|nr:Lrp/AsnC family transcriptional regulator [Micromonospora sp. PLK6-60]
MAENLDAIDWSILAELQDDGRLPITELSRRVQLSASATSERVHHRRRLLRTEGGRDVDGAPRTGRQRPRRLRQHHHQRGLPRHPALSRPPPTSPLVTREWADARRRVRPGRPRSDMVARPLLLAPIGPRIETA